MVVLRQPRPNRLDLSSCGSCGSCGSHDLVVRSTFESAPATSKAGAKGDSHFEAFVYYVLHTHYIVVYIHTQES